MVKSPNPSRKITSFLSAKSSSSFARNSKASNKYTSREEDSLLNRTQIYTDSTTNNGSMNEDSVDNLYDSDERTDITENSNDSSKKKLPQIDHLMKFLGKKDDKFIFECLICKDVNTFYFVFHYLTFMLMRICGVSFPFISIYFQRNFKIGITFF